MKRGKDLESEGLWIQALLHSQLTQSQYSGGKQQGFVALLSHSQALQSVGVLSGENNQEPEQKMKYHEEERFDVGSY